MGQRSASVGAAVRPTATLVRFGTFELDPSSGELKRNGRRIHSRIRRPGRSASSRPDLVSS